MINKNDEKHIMVFKDNKGHNLEKMRMVVFNNEVADIIEAEDIKFGLIIDENGDPTRVTIIERDGKHISQIEDRSISKLVVGVPGVKRDRESFWNDYTSNAYNNFLEKEKVKPAIDDYSDLSEVELKFLIEYLNMILIKKRVENSSKFIDIKNKIKYNKSMLEKSSNKKMYVY